jgi:hypothetical protein
MSDYRSNKHEWFFDSHQVSFYNVPAALPLDISIGQVLSCHNRATG